MNGWIGVDLDGTLALYNGWVGPTHIGEPIEPMVDLVKRALVQGQEVRIFTARCWPVLIARPGEKVFPHLHVEGLEMERRLQEAVAAIHHIQLWCKEHIGQELTITCVKDYGMHALYDDRAWHVVPNTGKVVWHG